MAFAITPDVSVEYDERGSVRHLEHVRRPYTEADAGLERATPERIAASYVVDVAGIYGIGRSMLRDLLADAGDGDRRADEPPGLALAASSQAGGLIVVSFVQTVQDLRIWEAGLAVTVLAAPLRVTSSRSTVHGEVKLATPGSSDRFGPTRLTPTVLGRLLGLKDRAGIEVASTRMLVYRFDPDARLDFTTDDLGANGDKRGRPALPVGSVGSDIEAGSHYLVGEALFSVPVDGWGIVNWRAFVEIGTGSVLYLRAAVTSCSGTVYLTDPPTVTGDATITPASPPATLDLYRSFVPLHGLTAANPQHLSGEYVVVQDDPGHVAPTAASPPCVFTGATYSVTTSDFAAVDCYHHLDEFYRHFKAWGYDPVTDFFVGTAFPVSAYFFAEGATVNAYAWGNSGSTSLDHFSFGSCATGAPVGIAVDWRVVMHEVGHHILYDRVQSPFYGFAHNGGDILGVLWMDPESSAPDRGLTFPWLPEIIGPVGPRRQDHPVSDGFAWGGAADDTQYGSEEVLSTSIFRMYRAFGGDSHDLAARQLAADYILYLKIHADASLGPSPVTPTPTAAPYVTALANADAAVTDFQGYPGGVLGKVARWAFEKQGLYQPAGAPSPVVTAGSPPDVDVYIDDGRHGEYGYEADFWENNDIWNRQAPDGGITHEAPILFTTNYVYVAVKNRGTQPAGGIVVRGFHCRPSSGLSWPGDWQAMTTAQITVPGTLAPGVQVIVGPFEWTPTEPGHECLLMYVNATGDISNADPASMLPCATGPTPHSWLVPFDNNIGQRNVAPVAAGGGVSGLVKSLEDRPVWINNPFESAVMVELEAELPEVLVGLGWQLEFTNRGGAAFKLGPLASRQATVALRPGREFDPAELRQGDTPAVIRVRARLNGIVAGGVTYLLDPDLQSERERQRNDGGDDTLDAADELLRRLGLPEGRAKGARIRGIVLDIEFDDRDE